MSPIGMARQVLARDWIAVALTFVASALAVILVLWMHGHQAGRAAAREEAALLARLEVETVGVLASLDEDISDAEARIRAFDSALRALSAGEMRGLTQADVRRGLNAAARYPALTPPRAVLEDVRATGRLDDIRNLDVRIALVRYATQLDIARDRIEGYRQAATEPSAATPDRAAVRRVYWPEAPTRNALFIDFQRLSRDPDFLDAMLGEMRNQVAAQQERRALRERAYDLCVALAGSGAPACVPAPDLPAR